MQWGFGDGSSEGSKLIMGEAIVGSVNCIYDPSTSGVGLSTVSGGITRCCDMGRGEWCCGLGMIIGCGPSRPSCVFGSRIQSKIGGGINPEFDVCGIMDNGVLWLVMQMEISVQKTIHDVR